MARVKQFGRYFIWCVAAAALVFCLGSLHLFASGLDQLTRDMKLDSAHEASLVYDRHNNLIFSFATEDRTNVPLDRVSMRWCRRSSLPKIATSFTMRGWTSSASRGPRGST